MYANTPWHGAGQGAADAALRYIALSDVLIDAYHAHIQPSVIRDPTLTITVTKSIKAFIDDVVMSASSNEPQALLNLINKAQAQLRWWNQLIQVTGGELNPSKCCAAIYVWQPDKLGILHPVQPKATETKITLTNENRQDHITVLNRAEGT